MTILINPFLYLIAFGPMAVLFASAIGLACGLLLLCVRAGARLAIIKRAHYPRRRPRLPRKGRAVGKFGKFSFVRGECGGAGWEN